MESFNEDISPSNKDNFTNTWRNRICQRLRKHIYNFILGRKNEKDFFDIDIFNRSYVKDFSLIEDIVNDIVKELNNLGWNTYIGFGGTGLYIYSSEELPDGVY